jgi:hypothetical protein
MTRIKDRSKQSDWPRRRWQHAPALVVSMVALFVALSGAALALPGQNTVTSGDIANETLKSVDLKDEKAVASEDVIDEALQSADVGLDTLQANDLAQNAVGTSELAPASVGPQEIGDQIHTHTGTDPVAGGNAENGAYNFGTATASCSGDEELISAGGYWILDAANDELTIAEVVPDHNAESVAVRGGNDSGDDATLVAWASCL